MQAKKPKQRAARSVLKNTKVKHYKDGSFTICRCSAPIFRPSSWECAETVNTANIETYNFWSEMFRELDENVIILRDDKGLPTKFWNVAKDERFHFKRVKVGDVRKDSLKRAKDCIFDIVYMNEWKYFITITFNGKDFERSEPKVIVNKLHNWLRSRVQRKGLAYVLVPEYHKKGGIHCHALVNDCDLGFVDSGTRCVKGFNKPVKLETIRDKGLLEKSGLSEDELKVVYNITDWKYGFSTAIQTYGDPANLAFYVTKYLTKDVKKIFGKFYWHSQNIVTKPDIEYLNTDFDMETPIVKVKGVNRSYQYLSSFTFSNLDNTEHEKSLQQIRECEEAERKFNELCEELGL
ncbi:hypothetical protein [Ruminococcus sp.]|uniref:rolling circle replication-associated protein n=1 Tax=Ruminococcus sp. TaxID=41978 RepID=UPI0025E5F742|nr:hypothetical protein [Ruminococcus sp.]MBQ8966268.1 hypothetical protein [Ruminococcus sp.]